MPRTARLEVPGGIHHVTARGNRKSLIFLDDEDRAFMLRRLRQVNERHAWRWLSYCLMPNHIHLVVETPRPSLGVGMRDLLGAHAREFNRRHDLTGHVFQGRYDTQLVATDQYFAQVLRYVANNPVKAELCRDAEEFAWSSHAGVLAGEPVSRAAATRVEQLLEPWGGSPGTRYAGLFNEADPRIAALPDLDAPDTRPALDEVLASGPRQVAWAAAAGHGYTVREIAEMAGVHPSTVSRRLRR